MNGTTGGWSLVNGICPGSDSIFFASAMIFVLFAGVRPSAFW